MVDEIPVLMIVPELDDISPAAEQQEVFEMLKCPKRMYFANGKRHLTILSGEGSEMILNSMAEFFKQALESSAM